jgi:hypothetical protein
MSAMRRTLIPVVLVFLSAFVSAQANVRINPGERSNRNAEYRQMVANYCRLDYDGARIVANGWTRMQPLTSWRDNPDFHRIAVVTRYQILPEAQNERGRSIYSVQYDVSGEYDLAGGYFPGADQITVRIAVGEAAGDTHVLDTTEPRPLVGRARLLQWLQAKLDSEKDPGAKNTLQLSLQRMQDENRKPVAGQ